jgi:hypothetical protein
MSYHAAGVCESNFNDLSKAILELIQTGNFDDAIEQIQRCINARNLETQERIRRGEYTDKAHYIVIKKLEDFLININKLKFGLSAGYITDQNIIDLYIYYCSSGVGFVFHFKGKTDTCDSTIKSMQIFNNEYFNCGSDLNEEDFCETGRRKRERGLEGGRRTRRRTNKRKRKTRRRIK